MTNKRRPQGSPWRSPTQSLDSTDQVMRRNVPVWVIEAWFRPAELVRRHVWKTGRFTLGNGEDKPEKLIARLRLIVVLIGQGMAWVYHPFFNR